MRTLVNKVLGRAGYTIVRSHNHVPFQHYQLVQSDLQAIMQQHYFSDVAIPANSERPTRLRRLNGTSAAQRRKMT